MAFARSRWGFEYADSSTSAKVQILFFRTKSGATGVGRERVPVN